MRASPDSQSREVVRPNGIKAPKGRSKKIKVEDAEDSPLSDLDNIFETPAKAKTGSKAAAKTNDDDDGFHDPEADGEEGEADPDEIREAFSRPPPVNSAYLPLPWKGRLGYACLCTYLRYANPPVFASRTCRIASIIENRHPLKDPTQPPHATKNRPDREQPADIARGQAYVEGLGLANARDVVKMLRWNEKYNIKFLRLSSEMFPFASHEEYGYKLAPFASEVLAEVGRTAAQFGHRLTTHPGQFTQLGSPRKTVIDNAIRDLEYHSEMLSLLKLPEQANRDAVMILHLGGTFGDKAATLDRFRENYKRLSQDIKNRLVLENDDVSWNVHELLPICEELNIPMVLDYHHHNIIFDKNELREGTLDIMDLYDRIRATWTRKGIRQKMHYSEPTPPAITGRDRRKHNPRVATLPPCAPDMDLMIEAKDKEQAVFELMRTFKLPGFERISDILPHVRHDENRPWKPPPKKKAKKRVKKADEDDIDAVKEEEEPEPQPPPLVPEEEISMGGPDNRVYWPPGMEDWLRPAKRVIKKKEEKTPKKGARAVQEEDAASVVTNGTADLDDDRTTPAKKRKLASAASTPAKKTVTLKAKATPKPRAKKVKNPATPSPTITPSPSLSTEPEMSELSDGEEEDIVSPVKRKGGRKATAAPAVEKPALNQRQSSRRRKAVEYKFEDEDVDME